MPCAPSAIDTVILKNVIFMTEKGTAGIRDVTVHSVKYFGRLHSGRNKGSEVFSFGY